ncbi:flagellar basal body-associated FliL family protein [bacterium]|nr:flagellar basal body-associated FliL family protein [bacterium]
MAHPIYRRLTAAALCLVASLVAPAFAADHGGGGGGDKKGESAGPVGPPWFVDLPDMLVNLNTAAKRPAFLKIKIIVEVAEMGDIAAVQHVMPMVLDGVQMYLRELRPENISGSAGMYRLRQDLVARIAAPSHPAKVKDVLFKELLVQ